MMQPKLNAILPQYIKAALDLYSMAKGWQAEDKVMQELSKEDRDLKDIYITRVKVLTINTYYAAGLRSIDIDGIAERIVNEVMPRRASESATGFVDLLAQTPNGNRHVVFSSKFAHFFISEIFPILDQQAETTIKFHVGRRVQSETKKSRYQIFWENFDRLKKEIPISCSYTNKDLDCYLWLAGSYKSWFSNGRKRIDSEISNLFTQLTVNTVPLQPLSDMLPPGFIEMEKR